MSSVVCFQQEPASVASLAAETLLSIFRIVAEPVADGQLRDGEANATRWLSLATVCKHWEGVVFNNLGMWTTLELDGNPLSRKQRYLLSPPTTDIVGDVPEVLHSLSKLKNLPFLTTLILLDTVIHIPQEVKTHLQRLKVADSFERACDLDWNVEEYYEWLYNLVDGCDALRCLHLVGTYSHPAIDALREHGTVELPLLRFLRVEDSQTGIPLILQWLNTPVCDTLYLQTALDEEDWAQPEQDGDVSDTHSGPGVFGSLVPPRDIRIAKKIRHSFKLKLTMDDDDMTLTGTSGAFEDKLTWRMEADTSELTDDSRVRALASCLTEIYSPRPYGLSMRGLVDLELHLPSSPQVLAGLRDTWVGLAEALTQVRRVVIGAHEAAVAFLRALPLARRGLDSIAELVLHLSEVDMKVSRLVAFVLFSQGGRFLANDLVRVVVQAPAPRMPENQEEWQALAARLQQAVGFIKRECESRHINFLLRWMPEELCPACHPEYRSEPAA